MVPPRTRGPHKALEQNSFFLVWDLQSQRAEISEEQNSGTRWQDMSAFGYNMGGEEDKGTKVILCQMSRKPVPRWRKGGNETITKMAANVTQIIL